MLNWWPSPDNPRGRWRDRAHPREADRDHQPRLGLRSSGLHTGLKISSKILDHGIASAWQDFDHDRWSLWPCTLTSALPSSGPSGSSLTMSRRTRSAFFYHVLTSIKTFKSLISNQQTFFSASVQPPCGRYQGKVGLILPVLPHHPVCLLLRVAQGDQLVQNFGNS